MAKFSFPVYCFNLTKEFNAREKIVANEYNKAVTEDLNTDMPKGLKINYTHYDVKAKRKEEKNFPSGLLAHAKKALN